MNHAEKVKELAQKFAEAHSHYCNSDDGEPADYALEWRREAVNNLHAAIDEMQAEIDRLRLLLADAAKQTRHPDYDWPLCLSKEVDSVVQHKAMAELQKEAQERGDYGRGDKT